MPRALRFFLFFFFNDTATTEIYTLSLHDALPISGARAGGGDQIWLRAAGGRDVACRAREGDRRLLPARLLRDLRLLFEDDLQRAAALRSSAGEQRPDRDRIGGCRSANYPELVRARPLRHPA